MITDYLLFEGDEFSSHWSSLDGPRSIIDRIRLVNGPLGLD